MADTVAKDKRYTYPSIGKFDNKMPFVYFKAYKYNCPKPEIAVLNLVNKKDPFPNMPVIALYMPGDFTESVNASWTPEDVYQGGTGEGWTSWMLSKIGNNDKFKGLDGGKVLSSIKAETGSLPFPTDISIFRSVDPMSFNLTFNMIPFDAEEGKNIMNIITIFKKAILPAVNEGFSEAGTTINDITKNVVLNFPPIWDLTFKGISGIGLDSYNKDGDGNSKYENMALTNCTVAYISGTEGASVYHDSIPTQIRMTLSFQSIRKHYIGSVK